MSDLPSQVSELAHRSCSSRTASRICSGVRTPTIRAHFLQSPAEVASPDLISARCGGVVRMVVAIDRRAA